MSLDESINTRVVQAVVQAEQAVCIRGTWWRWTSTVHQCWRTLPWVWCSAFHEPMTRPQNGEKEGQKKHSERNKVKTSTAKKNADKSAGQSDSIRNDSTLNKAHRAK